MLGGKLDIIIEDDRGIATTNRPPAIMLNQFGNVTQFSNTPLEDIGVMEID
jgi:hypothetical protein